ncbi:MAG: UDP-2,3-diacylglucosamine hydrolase LpxH, partial [Pseudomonadota bacterium]
KADAICLLGDVFEAWVGDDARSQPFEQNLTQVMAQASAIRPVCFMPGNRDFLVGPDLCAAAGMTPIADPTLLEAWGGRWVLCHGDALCLDDAPYQAFRAQVRSAAWQQAFLNRPLPERLMLAKEMRRRSRERHAAEPEGSGDLDVAACRQLLQQAGARVLLNGHTHRPAHHDLGDGLSREVLSDWDLDDEAHPRAEVLRLSADGRLSRLTPAQACQ